MTEQPRPEYEPAPGNRHTITAHIDLDNMRCDFTTSDRVDLRRLLASSPLITLALASLTGGGEDGDTTREIDRLFTTTHKLNDALKRENKDGTP